MKNHCIRVALISGLSLSGESYNGLPDWAAQVAQAAEATPAPAGAQAWVLLDRTEIAYVGDGEILQTRFRLVRILEDRGLAHAGFALHGLGGRASRVKRLKGWNLRPDGTMVRLNTDNVVTANDVTDAEFSTATLTVASVERVVRGSLVAYESTESLRSPMGPVAFANPMEPIPVHRWEMEVGKQEGLFKNLKAVEVRLEPRNLRPWVQVVENSPGRSVKVTNLPATPEWEPGSPHPFNLYPRIQVRFLDPALEEGRIWQGWDDLARWTQRMFSEAAYPQRMAELQGAKTLSALEALWQWMGRSLSYKQVYLTPDRGWRPEKASAVGRKRYGDCKDLSAFFMAEAAGLGFYALPVLARLQAGDIALDQEPFPVFNHALTAVKLDGPLGLPAEVETPKGRFLLVDPTDLMTPLGQLSAAYLDKHLLICLPDGAQWVSVPSKACMTERVDLQLVGEVIGQRLRGELILKESGNAWGLRAIAHRGGIPAVREALLGRLLGLPAHAGLEVERLGNPLGLHEPMEVAVRLDLPDGFRASGKEWLMWPLGLPSMPLPMPVSGVPRWAPVAHEASGVLQLKIDLRLRQAVKPILPFRQVETPFRAFTWQAKVEPVEGGSRLEIQLEHRNKRAYFPQDQREEGVVAWKKDRNQIKTLREDGFAFVER